MNFEHSLTSEEENSLRTLLIYVDEHKMNQVIRNLLSNAMKFTPKDGTVQIKLTMEQKSSNKSSSGSQYGDDIEKTCCKFPDLTTAIINSCRHSSSKYTEHNVINHIDGAKFMGYLTISIIDSGPGIEKVSTLTRYSTSSLLALKKFDVYFYTGRSSEIVPRVCSNFPG